jgi:Ca2+-binding RTX toxin-like protein
VTTGFTISDTNSAGQTTTDSNTSVVATALNYVNGPAGGHAILTGTPGEDVITAHGSFNAILGKGGNDIINAGDGDAAVTLGNGDATVTLGGSLNAVIGGTGNTTVTGAPGGFTAVTLGDGNDTVQIGGTHDAIILGTGTDTVSGTQGMSFITTGAGNDTITAGGNGNRINAGGGNNTITATGSNNTFVLPQAGQALDTINGFSETNSDVLDLRAALAATQWNHSAATLANFLQVTSGGGDTTLSIALSGSEAGTAIATLNGGTFGLTDLLSHHSLLT